MEKWLETGYWEMIISETLKWIISTLPSLLVVLILTIVTLKLTKYVLNKFKNIILFRASKTDSSIEEIEKRINTLVDVLSFFIKAVIWSIVIMIILRKFGVDIAPLIASAGIAGLAIGFGAQELVRDIISGFFILLENQIREGDVAIINGTGGLVEKITLRTITLRDLTGTVHIIQNGKINSLSNMTKGWSAMIFDIGVAYKEDTDNVMNVMREVANDLYKDEAFKNIILEPMEVLGVDAFGDSAVVIRARVKTKPIQQWTVGREYRRRLKKAFDEKNIEIPFPHRTIYWGEASDSFKIKNPD
jgi:moderate conductance mechanosensitive channel